VPIHDEKDYYDILEVSATATPEEIKTSRNLKLKFFHPDRFQHDPELMAEAERKTKEINQAYEVLSDPKRRADYDRAKGYAPSAEARLAEQYDQACSLLIQHRWREAIENLHEILTADPGYRDAVRMLRVAQAGLEQQTRQRSEQAGTPRPESVGSRCQVCGTYGLTKSVTFEQNIGVIVMRFHKRIQGELCGKCISKYFWEYSLITLLLGWWGIISFFASFVSLASNVVNYLPALTPGKRVLFLAAAVGSPVLLFVLLVFLESPASGPYPVPQAPYYLPTRPPEPTSAPRPTPSKSWESPSFLPGKPSPSAGPTRPATRQPNLPRVLPSPTHSPVQPSPVRPTPTGRDESFNQTVTAIGNWLATEEANATIAAHNKAVTPTPAVCRENVMISTPRHGSIVRGLVDIHGMATLPGFQFYKLEYSVRAQPAGEEWITIGELHNQPVVDGQLGTWDTSRLPTGQTWVRLVVVDQTGNFPEPCQVMVVVSK
jgi:hypothetical protein